MQWRPMLQYNSIKNVAIFQQQMLKKMFWLHPRHVFTAPPQSAWLHKANCENRCLHWCGEAAIGIKCNWGMLVFTQLWHFLTSLQCSLVLFLSWSPVRKSLYGHRILGHLPPAVELWNQQTWAGEECLQWPHCSFLEPTNRAYFLFPSLNTSRKLDL